LTILRAYHVAGRPRQDIRPWGGFDEWSREIRAPLVWLGLADPCATREQIIANDPERELTAEVLRAWHVAFGDKALLAREVIAAAGDGTHEELRQALLAIAARRHDSQRIDAPRLGHWLKSKKDRVIDGLRLNADKPIRGTQVWRVKAVGSVGSDGIKPADQTHPTRTPAALADTPSPENVCHTPFDRPVPTPQSPHSPHQPPAEDEIEPCVHGEDPVECVECREDVESREDVEWEDLD
jgi:hypothetical protein